MKYEAWAVLRPETPELLARCFELRWQVLRAPWGRPRGTETDELEDQSDHALIVDDAGAPVATGRLHVAAPGVGQIRYMAAAEHAQGRGLGGRVLAALEDRARARGLHKIVLNAREPAVAFYLKHGYQVVAPGETLYGLIPHHVMEKDL